MGYKVRDCVYARCREEATAQCNSDCPRYVKSNTQFKNLNLNSRQEVALFRKDMMLIRGGYGFVAANYGKYGDCIVKAVSLEHRTLVVLI